MKNTTMAIKNMVCDRCISAVKKVIELEGLELIHIELGEVQVSHPPSANQLQNIEKNLLKIGFELLEDRQSKLISKVKRLIIEEVQNSGVGQTVKLAEYLPKNLPYSYNYISQLFSEVEGITLEKYFILQKVERAKELILYNELTMSEIADNLGYSSVQHLSAQFKKVTGMTPSIFKKNRPTRKPLDQI